jgi:hypothetical protein
VLTQELHEGLQDSLGMIILVDIGSQQDRCPGVHKVKNLDHMLALAVATGIRRDRRGVLEINLDLAPRGSRRSNGRFLRWGAWRMRSLRRKTFQMVRVERGKRTFWSTNSA